MRLALCLFNYFPYGGLQRDFLRIARACKARGHEVHVYTMEWEGDAEPGLPVTILKVAGWQNHTRCRAFVQQLETILAQEKYDVVVGFNKMPNLDVYYAADVCYQARVREQRGFFYRLTSRYRQWTSFEEAVFQQGAKTHILLISPSQQQEFTHYYQTEAERFTLLPPGIAKDRIAPANAADIRQQMRAEYGVTPEQKVLLLVGSGFKTKGLDRVLRGIAALPATLLEHCQLWVVGQDHAEPFTRLAGELGISSQVRFLGGRPDVPRFLLAADLLVHPAYHENTGTVLLEAIVSGLPVLTVDVCGYAHYVTAAHAGKVLPSPFQQADFNLALEKMLSSQELQQWRDNGIAFAKQADIYSLPDKAAAMIEDVGTHVSR